jgi:hypothetical protein
MSFFAVFVAKDKGKTKKQPSRLMMSGRAVEI